MGTDLWSFIRPSFSELLSSHLAFYYFLPTNRASFPISSLRSSICLYLHSLYTRRSRNPVFGTFLFSRVVGWALVCLAILIKGARDREHS